MQVTGLNEDGLDASYDMYNIMDEFPSINELDPTEAFERKKDRSTALDEMFKNNVSFDELSNESVLSNKFYVTSSTEELPKEVVEPLPNVRKNTACSCSEPQVDLPAVEIKVPEFTRVPQTRGRSSLMNAQGIQNTKEEAFSFGNRARFSKKHDRGKQPKGINLNFIWFISYFTLLTKNFKSQSWSY